MEWGWGVLGFVNEHMGFLVLKFGNTHAMILLRMGMILTVK